MVHHTSILLLIDFVYKVEYKNKQSRIIIRKYKVELLIKISKI